MSAGTLAPGRARWLAGLVLASMFLTGVLVGVLLGRSWLVPRMPMPPFARGEIPFLRDSAARDPASHIRQMHRVIASHLGRELRLTPDQRAALDTVLAEQAVVLGAIQQEMEPRMQGFLSVTRQRIDSLLTDEQRERFRRLGPGLR